MNPIEFEEKKTLSKNTLSILLEISRLSSKWRIL